MLAIWPIRILTLGPISDLKEGDVKNVGLSLSLRLYVGMSGQDCTASARNGHACMEGGVLGAVYSG